jgi:hypothetical protein
MDISFPDQLLKPVYDMLARAILITPVASQPGAPAYAARGIYSSQDIDVPAENEVIISDQRTIVDIIAKEFAVEPVQFDRLTIPEDAENGDPALGEFEISDTEHDGYGEITLTVRKYEAPTP